MPDLICLLWRRTRERPTVSFVALYISIIITTIAFASALVSLTLSLLASWR